MTYNDNERALIWLSQVQGVQPYKKLELIDSFSSPSEAYNLYDDEKEVFESILGEAATQKLKEYHDISVIDKIIDELNRLNIKALTLYSDNYPDNLKHIIDSPICVYALGNIELLTDRRRIAIVGTRRLTRYGKDATRMFSRELAYNGFTIVSGMARGADTVAHEVALENDGRTVAVLGSGLDVVYPRENLNLYKDIISRGLVISEYPLGTQPYSYNFPQRNRIISGISDGILVIEAGEKSGTMITVDYALDQGKDVFVVPGSIFSEMSIGTNALIKDSKANMVTNINDILDEYNIKSRNIKPSAIQLDFIEQSIIDELKDNDMHFEELLSKSGLDVGKLMSILTKLEMYGIIRKLPGNNYGKVQGAN